jgi:hypothetical protein
MADEVIVNTVCHIHSKWSYDGNWELSKIASFFGRFGYRAVLTSEHDRSFDRQRWEEYKNACDRESTRRTLIIPGIEYSDAANAVHVLVWGVSDFLGKDRPTAETLSEAAKRNGICVLAHPSRREAWRLIDPSLLPSFHGIELWNRKFDGIAPSREAAALFNLSGSAIPFTGLDFHEHRQIFPLSMKIEQNGAVTREGILEAIRQKRCRPSVIGIPAEFFASGIPLHCAQATDKFRRVLSRIIRRK